MHISPISDIHLHYGHFSASNKQNADVLVVAGDTVEINGFSHYGDQELPDEVLARTKFFNFILDASDKFEHVVLVLGNHEYYGNNLNTLAPNVAKHLPSNVHLLNPDVKHFVEIDGIIFTGGTLWTDFGISEGYAFHRRVAYEATNSMNDFRQISYFTPGSVNELTTVRPANLIDHFFIPTKEAIFNTAKANQDKPVVVVTHHAPSLTSIPTRYRTVYPLLNRAYASDLDSEIRDNPNIVAWFHGHIHDLNDYTIGNCNVISNPRGYVGVEVNSAFDPEFCLDIKELHQG